MHLDYSSSDNISASSHQALEYLAKNAEGPKCLKCVMDLVTKLLSIVKMSLDNVKISFGLDKISLGNVKMTLSL